MKKTLFVLALITCILAGTCPVTAGQSLAAGQSVDAAPVTVEYMVNALAEYDQKVYVYKDFADGANTFTQKGWMGSSYTNTPPMIEYAEGIGGSTGIRASLNLNHHTWGGYVFQIGGLNPGSTSPHLAYDGPVEGMNLTGAEKLVFYARSETGVVSVDFYLETGGETISTGFIPLSEQWQRYEIPLEGVDLSAVDYGLAWVTNNKENKGLTSIVFYLDEIYFEFPEPSMDPAFLQSYAPVSTGDDTYSINNFAYLYDNSIAVIALNRAGYHDRAAQIADAIVYALENDRYYNDGWLRNAYTGGNPQSFPGWYSPKNAEFARLPGFYNIPLEEWNEDYYAVSTSTGNIAWAMLALCDMHNSNPADDTYLNAACKIGDFVISLKDEKPGFPAGYEGWEGSETKAVYRSTEHNIDLVAAFDQLARFTDGEEKDKWLAASQEAKDFVLSMYDETLGCFYTGTTDDGITVSRDVIPLDTNTWALMILHRELDDTDKNKIMTFVEDQFAVDGGYDFNNDKDGVWFEGTAQAALCYQLLGQTEKADEILAFMEQNLQSDGRICASDRDGMSTGFWIGGIGIEWVYYNRAHLGATAWLAFVQLKTNPFELPL